MYWAMLLSGVMFWGMKMWLCFVSDVCSHSQGLVAFSENGLVIRWWSLGSAWWEKLSRNFVPVQCTKLILVPPWEGISPNSSRASIMAHIEANGRRENSQVCVVLCFYIGQIEVIAFVSYRFPAGWQFCFGLFVDPLRCDRPYNATELFSYMDGCFPVG